MSPGLHPLFPGSRLSARAPLHLRQPNWPLCEQAGDHSGKPSRALAGVRVLACTSRPRVSLPNLFAFEELPHPHPSTVGPGDLIEDRSAAAAVASSVTSGHSPLLGSHFPTCLGPGKVGWGWRRAGTSWAWEF